jgi:hypothetical protein
MSVERPDALLARLKLGREEFCQRLLTSLILDGPYPKWNSRSTPSSAGFTFLQKLWNASFDDPWPDDTGVFVDELELLPRHEDERGGAPDYAVLWPDLVWLIELKTERTSHRRGQIPAYFDLGRYHHPTCRIFLTYLTPPHDYPYEVQNEWERYAHLTWPEAATLIEQTWGDVDNEDWRAVAGGLLDALDNLELRPSEWRAQLAKATTQPETAIEAALALAEQTAVDGVHRALEWRAPDLEALLALRLAVRATLAGSDSSSPLRHVMPWLWRPESTGSPLTASGRNRGFELRLSRYAEPIYED